MKARTSFLYPIMQYTNNESPLSPLTSDFFQKLLFGSSISFLLQALVLPLSLKKLFSRTDYSRLPPDMSMI